VYAAEAFLGPLDIPLKTYLYVCWMGTWGSLAAFLQKYAANQLGDRWKAYLLRDVVNSNLAAILVFWCSNHFGVPKALEAIAYTLAGYGGARTMEWGYRKWIATSDTLIDKKLNITPTPVPVVDVDAHTPTEPKP
jgi:hypothetical protein